MAGLSADTGLPPDFAAAVEGGENFVARLTMLQNAKKDADAARDALRLGVKISDGLAVAEGMQAEAKRALDDARQRAAGLIADAQSKAAALLADAQRQADTLAAAAQEKHTEADKALSAAHSEANTLTADLRRDRDELARQRDDLSRKQAELTAAADAHDQARLEHQKQTAVFNAKLLALREMARKMAS